MHLIHMKMKYFGSCQCRNTTGNTVCSLGTCALSLCENEIFWQLLVLKYLGEYGSVCGVIGALDTHENYIFWQLSAAKYSRKCCLQLGNMCTEWV